MSIMNENIIGNGEPKQIAQKTLKYSDIIFVIINIDIFYE
jgi:hypothetical protein